MKNHYDNQALYYDIENGKYHSNVTERQIDFLEWCFKKYLKGKPQGILEAACGTGVHGLELAKKGYEIYGVDLSAKMLAEYKKKIKRQKLENKIKLKHADLSDFKLEKKFDVATSLYNEIYEIKGEENLVKAFTNIYRNLNDKGLYIFMIEDFSKRKSLKKGYIRGEKGQTWIGFYESDGIRIQRTINEWVKGDDFFWDSFSIVDDNSKMRTILTESVFHLWGYDKLIRFLKKAGFKKIDCYSSMKERKLYKKGDGYMTFVAQK